MDINANHSGAFACSSSTPKNDGFLPVLEQSNCSLSIADSTNLVKEESIQELLKTPTRQNDIVCNDDDEYYEMLRRFENTTVFYQPMPLSPNYRPDNLSKILKSTGEPSEQVDGITIVPNHGHRSGSIVESPTDIHYMEPAFNRKTQMDVLADFGLKFHYPNRRKNYSKWKPVYDNYVEEDERVLARRSKQIQYGKNLDAYKEYVEKVKKWERQPQQPRTPDLRRKYSRRGWDGAVKKWKIHLHVHHNNNFQLEGSAGKQ